MRKFKALILNDYEGAHYATWVKEGKKKIETRMRRLFAYRGDIVICCGEANSVTDNAGKALCIVNIWKGRPMRNDPKEIEASCIGWDKDRKSLLLKDWRHFSYDFIFKNYVVKKEGSNGANYQGIFEIELPDDVIIIPKPEITVFEEQEETQTTMF
ncbi:MAG TPA: ASCH domain-containing protein [Bacteroidia bacterium]|nr:ASCH domain-containing protein [Bacteroidia bacterium]